MKPPRLGNARNTHRENALQHDPWIPELVFKFQDNFNHTPIINAKS